ncbi:kinase-like domain-containing protein [Mycena rosella]|uniref:Kinase-like domain-containing protein n=1 Tax=Mycena rosella TaxID=1033263 RepID=A0AAD7AYF8_MYCRO|nr:kinase-like domain-containing protein [Mycena rosella]
MQENASKAQSMIQKLYIICDKAPSSLFVTAVSGCGEHPVSGGAFSDIFRASYRGQPVGLKWLRIFHRGSGVRHIRSMVFQAAQTWKDLDHPNILPFIGIDRDTFSSSLALVSPWMEKGNVVQHLTNYGRASVNKLLSEIAQGLRYLHSKNLIHGNLRGTNILINQEWRACITDFGLSFVTTVGNSPDRTRGLRWMAPELIDPGDQEFTPTFASDVYAFGCVCMELYTGQPLFPTLSDIAAMFKIMGGSRPEQPFGTQPVMMDALWQLITECWGTEPETRPTMKDIVQDLGIIFQTSRVLPDRICQQELLPQSQTSQFPPAQTRCPVARSSRLPNIFVTVYTPAPPLQLLEGPYNGLGSVARQDSPAGLYNPCSSALEGGDTTLNSSAAMSSMPCHTNLTITGREYFDSNGFDTVAVKHSEAPQTEMLKPSSDLQIPGKDVQSKSVEKLRRARTSEHVPIQIPQPQSTEGNTFGDMEASLEVDREAEHHSGPTHMETEVSKSEDGFGNNEFQS